LLEKILSKVQLNWWDNVISRIYKLYNKNDNGKLEFQEFVAILNIVMKGSLEEKFIFSFKIVDVDGDNKINKVEFSKLLTILHRMYFTKDNISDPKDFVDMVWSKAQRPDTDLLSTEQLINIVIKKPLLSSYWNLE